MFQNPADSLEGNSEHSTISVGQSSSRHNKKKQRSADREQPTTPKRSSKTKSKNASPTSSSPKRAKGEKSDSSKKTKQTKKTNKKVVPSPPSPPKEPSSLPTKKTTKTLRPRRVRFNERFNQEHEDEYMFHYRRERLENWYNDDDYEYFRVCRNHTLQRAHELLFRPTREEREDQEDHGSNNNNNKAFKNKKDCRKSALRFGAALHGMYQAAAKVDYVLHSAKSLLMDHEEEGDKHHHGSSAPLIDMYTRGNKNNDESDDCCWTGLEVMFLPRLEHYMLKRMRGAEQVVLEVQSEVKRGLWDATEPGEIEQEMYDASRNFSQTSSLFAQMVALAQWKDSLSNRSAAATGDHNDDNDDDDDDDGEDTTDSRRKMTMMVGGGTSSSTSTATSAKKLRSSRKQQRAVCV